MRTSTIFAIAIIIFGAISMVWLFKSYTEKALEEVRNAKELTDEFRQQLAPESKVKLRRTPGAASYVNHDPNSYGLLLEASPDAGILKTDPTGFQFARQVASKAFDLYTGERPIHWIEVKLFRTDGTRIPSIGLQRGEGMSIVPIEAPSK